MNDEVRDREALEMETHVEKKMVLDTLFECWIEDDPVYGAVRDQYRELADCIAHLELSRIDRIDDLVAALCTAYSRAGFLAGARMGVKLILELSQEESQVLVDLSGIKVV